MPPSTHLIDLIELPTRQRQLVQLLLRNGTMLEADLLDALNLLAGETISSTLLEAELYALAAAGWLARDTLGDEARCRLRSLPRPRKHMDEVWNRIEQQGLGQNWRVRLPSAASTPRAQKRAGALFDALAAEEKEAAPKPEGLMQRGGKRTLPGAIWEKLEDDLSGESCPTNTKRSSGRLDLWQKISKSSEDKSN
jgi:hypothetical protein